MKTKWTKTGRSFVAIVAVLALTLGVEGFSSALSLTDSIPVVAGAGYSAKYTNFGVSANGAPSACTPLATLTEWATAVADATPALARATNALAKATRAANAATKEFAKLASKATPTITTKWLFGHKESAPVFQLSEYSNIVNLRQQVDMSEL